MTEATTLLQRCRGVTPPWQVPDSESHIGPVKVPWEIRRWYYTPAKGSISRAVQDFRITKKDRRLFDAGFRDKNITEGPTGFMHSNGSPVFDFDEVQRIFDVAEKEESSVKDAFLSLFETDPEYGMTARFISDVKAGPDVYPRSVADKRNEILGLGVLRPDDELAALEAENHVLQKRQKINTLKDVNAQLREEVAEEQQRRVEALEKGFDDPGPQEEDAPATTSRVRKRRIKRTE